MDQITVTIETLLSGKLAVTITNETTKEKVSGITKAELERAGKNVDFDWKMVEMVHERFAKPMRQVTIKDGPTD